MALPLASTATQKMVSEHDTEETAVVASMEVAGLQLDADGMPAPAGADAMGKNKMAAATATKRIVIRLRVIDFTSNSYRSGWNEPIRRPLCRPRPSS